VSAPERKLSGPLRGPVFDLAALLRVSQGFSGVAGRGREYAHRQAGVANQGGSHCCCSRQHQLSNPRPGVLGQLGPGRFGRRWIANRQETGARAAYSHPSAPSPGAAGPGPGARWPAPAPPPRLRSLRRGGNGRSRPGGQARDLAQALAGVFRNPARAQVEVRSRSSRATAIGQGWRRSPGVLFDQQAHSRLTGASWGTAELGRSDPELKGSSRFAPARSRKLWLCARRQMERCVLMFGVVSVPAPGPAGSSPVSGQDPNNWFRASRFGGGISEPPRPAHRNALRTRPDRPQARAVAPGGARAFGLAAGNRLLPSSAGRARSADRWRAICCGRSGPNSSARFSRLCITIASRGHRRGAAGRALSGAG